MDCAVYEQGVRRAGPLELDDALEAAHEEGDRFVWIGLYEPTAEEFGAVTAEFGLHPLAVEEALRPGHRARLEVYDDVAVVVLKTVHYVDSSEVIEVGEVLVFLNRRFVVVVRRGRSRPLAAVRRRLEADPELLRTGPGAVLYAIADHIVDEYEDAADGVDSDIDEIEFAVFGGRRPGHDSPTERLYKLMREVLEFRRAVRPMVSPLGRIGRGEVAVIDAGTGHLFRDVEGHLLRAAERIDVFTELLTNALGANTAQIQSRQNEDMRKITAWVAILGANTLIVGIYGQNFVHMPELRWTYGYPGALAVMLAVSTFLYRGFRRNHWI